MELSLTQALLLAAAGVVVLVLVQGWWSARRATPRRAAPDTRSGAGRVEPALGEAVAAPAAAELRAPGPRRSARLDALIDAIVPMTLEAPVSGEHLLAHLPSTRRAGSKPLIIEGLDTETGDWQAPAAGRRYGELQAGVQMANRAGALNEIEYSEFVQKMQAFADAVGAMPDFPDMLDVAARARELDAFASPCDAQLTVTLKSQQVAWSVGYLQQCAARHGFVAGALPGRLVLPAAEDGAPPMLVLGFDPQAALAEDPAAGALRDCLLSMDLAQTPESAEPYPAWHRTATGLADDLGAVVVDDQGAPITLHAFAAIGAEVEQLYRRLERRDLAAGSAAARRLFSG